MLSMSIATGESDRLARNLDDLRLLVKKLTAKSVKVCFVKESLTSAGSGANLLGLQSSRRDLRGDAPVCR